jgi:hypothetical protein
MSMGRLEKNNFDRLNSQPSFQEFIEGMKRKESKMRKGGITLVLITSILTFLSSSFAVEPKATPAKALPATTSTPSAFDLSIDRIYLHEPDCKIHVVLRNLGTEKVPDDVFRTGRLRIVSEHFKNVPPWFLSQVDMRRDLNGSKKLKDFDTGLILGHQERVTFRFENVKDKESSNDSRTVDLTPSSKCMQVKSPVVTQLKPLPKIEPMREVTPSDTLRRVSPALRPDLTTRESSEQKTTPSPSPGVSISSAGSSSITVSSPSKGDIVVPGNHCTIRWKATGITDNVVAIDLFYPGTQLTPKNYQNTWWYLVEATPNNGAYVWENVSLSIPYQGPLQIRVRTVDGKVYGDSEIFSIGTPPAQAK